MKRLASVLRALKSAVLLLAKVGPALGGFSLMAAAAGVIALVMAGLVYLLLPELRSSALSLLALGLIFLLIFLLGAFREIRAALLGRRGRYGTNTTIMLVAFLGIAILANFIGVRNHRRFDVTAGGQFSLSQQTLKILDNLKDKINVVGFFSPMYSEELRVQDDAKNLLVQYAYHSNKITYSFVDPDAKPAVARQYNVKEYPTLVFEIGERRESLSGFYGISEQDITSAILRVTGTQQKKVYVLSGHDERDILNSAGEGLSYAKQGLQGDNYQVETLSLATEPKVPEDAVALVIAAPQKPLLEKEAQAIEEYLEKGGKALILVDPKPIPELEDILARWGVVVKKGAVVDAGSSLFGDVTTPVVVSYPPSQITKDLKAATIFPDSTYISPTITVTKTLAAFPLIQTSGNSWLETDPKVARFDEGVDVKGPLTLGVTIEGTAPLGKKVGEEADQQPQKKPTRLVVIGDSDFASNDLFYSLGDSDLFLNSVNWLAEEEGLISIRAKPSGYRKLVATQAVWRWILYSSMTLLPLAVALIGGFSWWRRR